MKKILSVAVLVISFAVKTFANEGMWIPSLVAMFNESEMKTMGMKLSAEDLYSVNKSSLKDAIVLFGGGCTGEMISDQGLLLTNHHCGYGQIQKHSSVTHDYLTDGFWAYSKKEELKNEGLTATFFVRIDDVTEAVLKGAEGDRKKIAENIAALTKAENEKTGYKAIIKPFFYGNQYFMLVSKTYNDVRLVGAPPSSIGKYGFDTDNWVWPRHTGDFSIFRIYADADNEPAEISDSNVPYKPAHHLPVSLDGVKEGDFTMVYGFPGRTEQYLPASEVEFITSEINPARIAMRTASLSVIDAAMKNSDEVRIKYAAKQSRISNAWKKWQGENLGIRKTKALKAKKDFEAEFIEKAKNKGLKGLETVSTLDKLVSENKDVVQARNYFIEMAIYGPELLRFARNFNSIIEKYNTLPDEITEEDKVKWLKTVEGFYKDYDRTVDQRIFEKLLPLYLSDCPKSYQPASISADKDYTHHLYSTSILDDGYLIIEGIKKLDKKFMKKLQNDDFLKLSAEFWESYMLQIKPSYDAYNAEHDELIKTFIAQQMKVFPDKRFWSDANSTLRIAYGTVSGSAPHDGMAYTPFTNLDGVMDKYIPGDDEFDLPTKLVELYEKKDYGQYESNNSVPVCFTASNHTTGGNSGSPVIDANGYLIGLNFDRTWESTMSDLYFSEEICRNIAVDVRYVMFIVDKLAGAQNLIDEITFVKAGVVMK